MKSNPREAKVREKANSSRGQENVDARRRARKCRCMDASAEAAGIGHVNTSGEAS